MIKRQQTTLERLNETNQALQEVNEAIIGCPDRQARVVLVENAKILRLELERLYSLDDLDTKQ
jgi:hypothetical protein